MSPGLQNLRRYFELIIFQWYLQSTEPDTIRSVESIETFVQNRPGMLVNIIEHNIHDPSHVCSNQDFREGTAS